jgi:hypothetical protein
MFGVLVLGLLVVTGIYLDLQRMQRSIRERARARASRCDCPVCERKRS